MAKTYILATERDGKIVALKVPPMAIRQAEEHAQRLRQMVPNVPVYVLNVNAL
jgi:hypothetical protein